MFLHDEFQLCIFGKNFAEVMLYSQYISIRRFDPITIDVNFYHLVKMMSVRFLHYKEVNKCFVGRYVETTLIACFSSDWHPLVFTSIDDSYLSQLFL